MSINTSESKRSDLVSKIKAIRSYIAKPEQDEHTANFPSFLSEIEKEGKWKKCGLVFEEHQENVDDTLLSSCVILR